MVIRSDEYHFMGKLFGNEYRFFHKNKKELRTIMSPKFKWIDKENDIVYFIDGEKISYSYSAINKHSKEFLDEKLTEFEKLFNRKNYIEKGQVYKYKDIKNKSKNGKLVEVTSVSDDRLMVYYVFKDKNEREYCSMYEFLSHTICIGNK